MMVSPLGFKFPGLWRASLGSEVAHGQGDTRPTSLAGLLQDLSLAGNVRDFACANFARQGPFGIPHAFGGKKKVRPEAFVCMQTVVEKTRE